MPSDARDLATVTPIANAGNNVSFVRRRWRLGDSFFDSQRGKLCLQMCAAVASDVTQRHHSEREIRSEDSG